MDILAAILNCTCGPVQQHDLDEKSVTIRGTNPRRSNEDITIEVVNILRTAEKDGHDLKRKFDDAVGTTGWTEDIAIAILGALEQALNDTATVGQVMKEALEKAAHEAYEFAREHPVFCTVLALGVLVLLAPWVIEALGFGELGPIEGSFAAWWQARYAGYVPKGSLFSFFQRLGMIWG